MTDQGRSVARDNIGNEMARRGWNVSDLVRAAGIDAGTAGDFLNGSRWPQQATQKKIEDAFEWPRGIIRRWELELEPGTLPTPPAAEPPPTPDIFGPFPPGAFDGLSAADREEVLAIGKAAALARAREIKRERNS